MPRCSYPEWGLGSPGSAGRRAGGSPGGSRGGPPARGNLGAGTGDGGRDYGDARVAGGREGWSLGQGKGDGEREDGAE